MWQRDTLKTQHLGESIKIRNIINSGSSIILWYFTHAHELRYQFQQQE